MALRLSTPSAVRLLVAVLAAAALATVAFVGASLATTPRHAGAVSEGAGYFLKIPGIPGESKAAGHAGEIDISTFSFGATNTVTSGIGGGGAGKATFTSVTFTKLYDKSSPLLFLRVATGRTLSGDTVFTAVKGGAGGSSFRFLTITLTNVRVVGYSVLGNNAQVRPMDTFQLAFQKIKIDYRTQTPTGGSQPVTVQWDVIANRGG